MPDLVSSLGNEWQAISNAPASFLTAVAIVCGTAWALARWHYAGRIDTLEHRLLSRDDEIKALNAKLADALATPKEASPKASPSDPNEIRQYDRVVGRLNHPDIRYSEGIVTAQTLTATNDFNPQLYFAFRDLDLQITATAYADEGETGREFQMVVCKIL